MNFLDLTTSGENEVDRWIIDDIKKESEFAFIKRIAKMVSIPIRSHNSRRGTDIKLRDWSGYAFGSFVTYGFFLYRFKSTFSKPADVEKTISLLMESLANSLIEEHRGLEIDKTLVFMQENIGLSKKFHNSLTEYFVVQKDLIVALQSEDLYS